MNATVKRLITRPRLSSSARVCRSVLAEAKTVIMPKPDERRERDRRPEQAAQSDAGEGDDAKRQEQAGERDDPPQPHDAPPRGQVHRAASAPNPDAALQNAQRLRACGPPRARASAKIGIRMLNAGIPVRLISAISSSSTRIGTEPQT